MDSIDTCNRLLVHVFKIKGCLYQSLNVRGYCLPQRSASSGSQDLSEESPIFQFTEAFREEGPGFLRVPTQILEEWLPKRAEMGTPQRLLEVLAPCR